MCEYASQKNYNEDEDFYSTYFVTHGWDTVTGMFIDDDMENNVVKKKGKYIKVVDYFHTLFDDSGDHPLPVEVHLRSSHGPDEFSYIIELEDNEEFDIKKVQIVKSDYEIECCPYFIISHYIMYDGKKVDLCEEDLDCLYDGYCIEGRFCSEYVIDSYING